MSSTNSDRHDSAVHRTAAGLARLAIAVMLATLAACTTQPGTINNRLNLESDETALIGSRQRAIINIPVADSPRPGLITPRRVVCAEPSPDVALAIAQSFGAGLSILGGGGAQGSGALSGASAEGVASLVERTQSIQLLRDQMYRTCEAYGNGAITGTTYNLRMAKYDKAMVTLMLGEVAGGAFGRSGAAIGGKAEGKASSDASLVIDMLREVEQSQKAVEDAQQEEKDAEAKVADKKEIAEKDGDETAARQAENDAAVTEAERELATVHRKVQDKRDAKTKAEAEARAEITKVVGVGSIDPKVSTGIAEVLGRMQGRLLDEDFQDEYVSACLVELGIAPGVRAEEGKREKFASVEMNWATQVFGQIVRDNDPTKARRSQDEYLEFLGKLNRTRSVLSGLATHCEKYLASFVDSQSRREFVLDQEKNRLTQQELTTTALRIKQETLSSYEKILGTCSKIEDAAVKAKCLDAASSIVQAPTGAVTLNDVTVERPPAIPAGEAPLPTLDYRKADAALAGFLRSKSAFDALAMPALDKAKVKDDDFKALASTRAALDKDVVALKNTNVTLTADANSLINPTRNSALQSFENNRSDLVRALRFAEQTYAETSDDADETIVDKAEADITGHDLQARIFSDVYLKIAKRLGNGTAANEAMSKRIKDLADAVDTAEKAKVAGT